MLCIGLACEFDREERPRNKAAYNDTTNMSQVPTKPGTKYSDQADPCPRPLRGETGATGHEKYLLMWWVSGCSLKQKVRFEVLFNQACLIH